MTLVFYLSHLPICQYFLRAGLSEAFSCIAALPGSSNILRVHGRLFSNRSRKVLTQIYADQCFQDAPGDGPCLEHDASVWLTLKVAQDHQIQTNRFVLLFHRLLWSIFAGYCARPMSYFWGISQQVFVHYGSCHCTEQCWIFDHSLKLLSVSPHHDWDCSDEWSWWDHKDEWAEDERYCTGMPKIQYSALND